MLTLRRHALRTALLALALLFASSPGLFQRAEAAEPKSLPDTPAVAKVGMPAPDFSLEAVVGTEPGKEFKTVNLADFRGKWLVLFFYPADFTFVCPTEIKGFNAAGTAMLTGQTASHVRSAIFQRGGGFCGERNQASSPFNWRYTGSPSTNGWIRSSQALNIGEA